MLKSSIKPGVEYALREKPAARDELQRIRIVELVRGNKWKAEWIEPNPGLVDYVESGQLVATWKEHKAFLKEEENEKRLKEENERTGYRNDSPVDRAMYEVFENAAEGVGYYRGTLSGKPEDIARMKTRAGMDADKHSPFGYLDRAGTLRLPFGDAVELARAFCGAEPSTILQRLEVTERDWSQRARIPGEEHMVGLLNEYRAAWALLRQWAGHDCSVGPARRGDPESRATGLGRHLCSSEGGAGQGSGSPPPGDGGPVESPRLLATAAFALKP